MKLTASTLFTFGLEHIDDRQQRYQKALGKIRSPIFKKFMESLNGKTPDQDYERFLGLIDLISANITTIPKQKKAFEMILAPDYLKGVDSKKVRDTVYDDLTAIYEELKRARQK